MKNYSISTGRRLLYCIICLFIISFSSNALEMISFQQSETHGTITDIHGMPLVGVSILIKGKQRGTISDFNGSYTIQANKNDVLLYFFLGFKTLEIPIEGQVQLDVQMEAELTALNTVEINAGYYTVKDKERTGNISKISASEIEKQPITNPLAALQGRVAGVEITQTSGVPGAGFNIKIRGQNSLRTDANAPLYIIDGVPYASDALGSNFTATIFPTLTSPLNNIDPSSIESIEILKDADATAIYGSRGANGVVLITTKKGKIGKTSFNVHTSTGVGQVTRSMKLMNTEQYLTMRNQAFENDGYTTYPAWAYDINGTWDASRYTDWQKELTGKTARFTSLGGTVSGGSEQTQFLFGSNYNSQTTVFPGDFIYRKGGIYLSLNQTSLDNRFKLVLSGNYTVQNNNQPAFDPTIDARKLAPNAPELYDSEGNLNWENSTWTNPLASFESEFKSRTNNLIGNMMLSYEILPSLEVKTSLGYSDIRHSETRTAPSTVYNPAFGLGSEYSALFVNSTDRQSWIVEPQISYKTQVGKARFQVLLGSTFQQQVSEVQTAYGTGFTSNNLIYNLASASNKDVVLSNQTIYKYQAFFGRLNFNWKERYIVNLTGRRDGSSRFGPGNQFANFAALGTAWIFSKESVFKDNSVISFGKLRASYGTSGNDQIGDYQFLDTYTSSGSSYQGVVGLKPSRLFNRNFQWETNKKLELGLEMGFLNDHIFVTGSVYQNRSSDQLVGIPLSSVTGFTSIQSNLNATVQNKGYEFTWRSLNISHSNFNWTTNLNLTLSKNKLLKFPNLESSVYKEQYRVGKPLNIKLSYHYTGIDPDTGVYQYLDVNGDNQISFPVDRQTVVDLNPEFFGGLQNQFGYKRWTLDFLFQFVKQRNSAFTLGNAGTMVNQPVALINSWQNTGDNAQYQVYTIGVNQQAVRAQSLNTTSDAGIVDASFIRLKNISLTYDLPLHLKQSQCQLSIQAQNLLTITPYQGGDPEFGTIGYLPPLRMITAGIQLTF